jgi:hypothetical protein
MVIEMAKATDIRALTVIRDWEAENAPTPLHPTRQPFGPLSSLQG